MNLKKRSAYYGRFKGAPWFDKMSESTIFVMGQGGIGSHLTFFLARTGANIVTADFDSVELGNLAGQLYGKKEVGLTKTEAMNQIIDRLCGENNITPLHTKIEIGKDETAFQMIPECDVVCTSFDSIAIRRIIFEKWLELGKDNSLFVDGRMSMEQGNIFTIPKNSKPEVIKHYRESCFDDSEIEELGCTTKATTHCGSFIASLMTAQITNWFTNQVDGVLERNTPTQINFNLPLMLFEQINL